jgi:hypothetical protein
MKVTKHMFGACVVGVALWGTLSGAQAQSIYGKAGFLGMGVGYAQGVTQSFTLRADVVTAGSFGLKASLGEFDYKARLRSTQGGAYADWFPFDSGFRFTVGVSVRDTRADIEARSNIEGTITVGDFSIPFRSEDEARAQVKLPSVAPYVGIGWGHDVKRQKPGWGLVADLGVAFGRPKVSFEVNDAVLAKLDFVTGGNGQAEVDKQREAFKDDMSRFKIFPQAYLGAAYYF